MISVALPVVSVTYKVQQLRLHVDRLHRSDLQLTFELYLIALLLYLGCCTTECLHGLVNEQVFHNFCIKICIGDLKVFLTDTKIEIIYCLMLINATLI